MVLALALFVGAATIISSGINASVQAVYRLRLETHAANLAISLLSELQMQARPLAAAGPEPFDAPFTNWTYQVDFPQGDRLTSETDALRAVEVIIRHNEEPIVYRLTQLFRSEEIKPEGPETPRTGFSPGGSL